jgi:hypothetical protein
MDERRPRANWPIVAGSVAPLLLLAALGIYAGAYFTMTAAINEGPSIPMQRIRYYDKDWKARLCYPAGQIEGAMTGKRVKIKSYEGWGDWN